MSKKIEQAVLAAAKILRLEHDEAAKFMLERTCKEIEAFARGDRIEETHACRRAELDDDLISESDVIDTPQRAAERKIDPRELRGLLAVYPPRGTLWKHLIFLASHASIVEAAHAAGVSARNLEYSVAALKKWAREHAREVEFAAQLLAAPRHAGGRPRKAIGQTDLFS